MTARSSSSLLRIAGTSVASGVATAVLPPARLPAGLRRSLHVALGLGASGAVLAALSRPGKGVTGGGEDDAASSTVDEAPLPLPARIGLAAGFGGLVTLASVGGWALDAKVERALSRRGSQHPRLWIGAAAAVFSAATSLVEERPKPSDAARRSAPDA